MLEVVSIHSFSDRSDISEQDGVQEAVSPRRGGFLHGTKIATTSGWKVVERIVVGDLVRTLDHGFREVRRISVDRVAIPEGESRPESLPIFVPAQAAYNGNPVWLMPEQGIALDLSKIDNEAGGFSVVPARLLNGKCRLSSQVPGSSFDVRTLYFDEDEVIFVQGGLQAFCSCGRFSMRPRPNRISYPVATEDEATALIDMLAAKGDLSALSNPMGALPAPIPQDPIFPIRPPAGMRRPGRPGRPNMPTLFLRSEWRL